MRNFLRELVITLGSKILPSNAFLERLLSISILTIDYRNVSQVKRFDRREDMWEDGIKNLDNESICYLEFGVWEGKSIRHIAEFVTDANSKFYGFDSFEGLPEEWDTMSGVNVAGHFSVGGNTPKIDDDRVKFVKGWFQNSVPEVIDEILNNDERQLVVHYDADLYSSTMFCLMQIEKFKKPYLAIFDEFPGHETRALYNYQQVTGAKVDFIARVGPTQRYPWQVMAWITPQKIYEVD